MHRYGSIFAFYDMRADLVIEMIKKAADQEFEDRAHKQWTSMLPLMCIKYIEYESFQAYLDRLNGKGIDLRPADDILSEVNQIRAELEE